MIRRWVGFLSSPALHDTEPQPERHATWLELFFDLVFVVAAFLVGSVVVQWASPEYVSPAVLRARLAATALVLVAIVAFEAPRTRDTSVGPRARPGD